MGIITSDIPDPGNILRGPGEVEASGFMTEVKNALNGGLDSSNLGPQLQSQISPAFVPYGGGLPASPVDGQKILVQLHPGAGLNGEFRYNASSASPFKWEAVGQTAVSVPSFGQVHVPSPITQVSWAWTTTWAGEFDVEAGVYGAIAASLFATSIVFGPYANNPSSGFKAHVGRNVLEGTDSGNPASGITLPGTRVMVTLDAGDAVYLGATASGNGALITGTSMTIWPRRIG